MKTVTWPAKADWRLFASIFLVVFGVDVAVSFALSALAPPSVLKGAAVDAVAVTIIAGPLLRLIVVRGLARNAAVERLSIETQLATILATSVDGIVTTDSAGVVSHFNTGAEQIFGYPAGEILGRNISLLVPERARAVHAEHLGAFASGADNSRAMGAFATLEGRRKSGELFPVDISISKLDIDGNVMLTAVVRDITERKRAETVLRETESFLRAVLNNAPIAIWATDADGVLTLSDGRALERAGLKPGEHVGEPALDLFADLRFVGHAGGELTGREVLLLALAGETVVAVTELRGTFLENHIGPQLGPDGTVVGVVGVATDITERTEAFAAERRSQERFRTIFNRAPLGIALTDLTGRFFAVNAQYARIVGRTVDELARLDWMRITHPDDVSQDLANTALPSVGTNTSVQIEKRYLDPDGKVVWAKMTVARMPGDSDASPYDIAMVEDITERKRTQDVLEQSLVRLQSLSNRLLDIQERERRQLAMELHDEIGQVLTAVKINLQLLQRHPDQTAAAPRLADSVRIIDRVLQQVRSLSLSLRPPLLDDLGLAAALRWLVAESAQRKGTHVEFRDGVAAARFDAATEVAGFRIVQEALNNVDKHSDARNVTVDAQVLHDELHVRVFDDGVGFDVALARRRAAGGASLGLLGMEERATLASGGIEWHSVPDQGTEVHAWFPLHGTPDTGAGGMALG